MRQTLRTNGWATSERCASLRRRLRGRHLCGTGPCPPAPPSIGPPPNTMPQPMARKVGGICATKHATKRLARMRQRCSCMGLRNFLRDRRRPSLKALTRADVNSVRCTRGVPHNPCRNRSLGVHPEALCCGLADVRSGGSKEHVRCRGRPRECMPGQAWPRSPQRSGRIQSKPGQNQSASGQIRPIVPAIVRVAEAKARTCCAYIGPTSAAIDPGLVECKPTLAKTRPAWAEGAKGVSRRSHAKCDQNLPVIAQI